MDGIIDIMKKRKPRTTGFDIDFDGAHLNDKETMFIDTISTKKMMDRYFRKKVCIGCGKKKCQCKSKMDPKTPMKYHKG